MSKKVLSFVGISVIFVTAVQVATAQSDEVAIKNLIASYAKVVSAGDVDGIMDLWMPDAVFMPHGAPAQVGDKAIRAFYQDTLFRHVSPDINIDPVEVVVLDGWAFVRVEATGTITWRDSGRSEEINNKGLFVLRRTNAGTWKFVRLMWNMNSLH